MQHHFFFSIIYILVRKIFHKLNLNACVFLNKGRPLFKVWIYLAKIFQTATPIILKWLNFMYMYDTDNGLLENPNSVFSYYLDKTKLHDMVLSLKYRCHISSRDNVSYKRYNNISYKWTECAVYHISLKTNVCGYSSV